MTLGPEVINTSLAFFQESFAAAKLDTKIERADSEAVWIMSQIEDAFPELSTPRVLDLGCGQGRVSIALARKSARVVGVDFNQNYLAEAKRRAFAQSVILDWRFGDDRALSETDSFEGVISMFSSFGYHSDEENRLVLKNISRALVPNGLLILESQNRDNADVRSETVALETLQDGTELLKTYQFDPRSNRKQMHFRYIRDAAIVDGGKLAIQLYSLGELTDMCFEVGLEVKAVYGSSRGLPFNPLGEKLIMVARKEIQ